MSSSSPFWQQIKAMGTTMDIVLIGQDPSTASLISKLIQSELGKLELLLSLFRPESSLSQLNHQLQTQPKVTLSDPRLTAAIRLAKDMHRLSHGCFDVGIGRLIHQQKDQITNAGVTAGIGDSVQALQLSANGDQLNCQTLGLQLDFGGLGKGMAMAEVERLLQQFDVESALISFGQSSIFAKGRHPHGDHWQVSLPEPYDSAKPMHTLKLRDTHISVSSTISNDASANTEIRPHLVSAQSGGVITQAKTVIVQHRCPASAEALSTGLLLANKAQQQKICRESLFTAVEFSHSQQGPSIKYSIQEHANL